MLEERTVVNEWFDRLVDGATNAGKKQGIDADVLNRHAEELRTLGNAQLLGAEEQAEMQALNVLAETAAQLIGLGYQVDLATLKAQNELLIAQERAGMKADVAVLEGQVKNELAKIKGEQGVELAHLSADKHVEAADKLGSLRHDGRVQIAKLEGELDIKLAYLQADAIAGEAAVDIQSIYKVGAIEVEGIRQEGHILAQGILAESDKKMVIDDLRTGSEAESMEILDIAQNAFIVKNAQLDAGFTRDSADLTASYRREDAIRDAGFLVSTAQNNALFIEQKTALQLASERTLAAQEINYKNIISGLEVAYILANSIQQAGYITAEAMREAQAILDKVFAQINVINAETAAHIQLDQQQTAAEISADATIASAEDANTLIIANIEKGADMDLANAKSSQLAALTGIEIKADSQESAAQLNQYTWEQAQEVSQKLTLALIDRLAAIANGALDVGSISAEAAQDARNYLSLLRLQLRGEVDAADAKNGQAAAVATARAAKARVLADQEAANIIELSEQNIQQRTPDVSNKIALISAQSSMSASNKKTMADTALKQTKELADLSYIKQVTLSQTLIDLQASLSAYTTGLQTQIHALEIMNANAKSNAAKQTITNTVKIDAGTGAPGGPPTGGPGPAWAILPSPSF